MICKIGNILYSQFHSAVCLLCKRQSALLPRCSYIVLYRACYIQHKLLAAGKGLHKLYTAAIQSFASHHSAPLQRTGSSAPLICKGTSSTAAWDKSTSASKKSGQGQPPPRPHNKLPDSNSLTQLTKNRNRFLGKSSYITGHFNPPLTTRRLSKKLLAGPVHQPAPQCKACSSLQKFSGACYRAGALSLQVADN